MVRSLLSCLSSVAGAPSGWSTLGITGVLKSFTSWSTSGRCDQLSLLLQMSKPTWACWDDNIVTCPGKGGVRYFENFHLTTLCADTNKVTTIFPSKEWNLKDLPSKRRWSTWKAKEAQDFWMEEKQRDTLHSRKSYFPPGLHSAKWLEAESHRFCICLLA